MSLTFKDRAEAEGEKDRLEVAAANRDCSIRPINTRLTTEQVRAAEAAFGRLGAHTLTDAVDYFLKHFRPAVASVPVEIAAAEFMRDREPVVSISLIRLVGFASFVMRAIGWLPSGAEE